MRAEVLVASTAAVAAVAAVVIAAFSSSFASVYFERLLKANVAGESVQPAQSDSLWQRNLQLCAWTVPMNMLLALTQVSRRADHLPTTF